MYNNALELKAIIDEKNSTISGIVLENECRLAETTPEKIMDRTYNLLKVMKESATLALNKDVRSVSGFTGGDAKRMNLYSQKGNTICGTVVNQAMAKAFSSSEVNASMGKVVAAPTAGSCGIVPAAILTCGELLTEKLMSESAKDFPGTGAAREQLTGAEEVADPQAQVLYVSKLVETKMALGLLTAAGIGQIIAKNATLSGAEGGCQAECGAAAAMAAAALVEMYGGTPDMAFNAAGIAIMNILGLVCDPVAGLVELPCAKRNASGVINAMTSADMGLAGVESVIPFDEIVEAMYRIGKIMPVSLKETAMGGLAATPTGKRMACQLYGEKPNQ